ncbi:hypothetical protein HDU81_008433 [Chytriomyces hyalinus]|nr:hypothetical protein HDU81_008433 [Chytriomyces hyalinus]
MHAQILAAFMLAWSMSRVAASEPIESRDGTSMMASLVNSTYTTFKPCTKKCIRKYASVRPPITMPQIEKLCKTAVSETATMTKLSACVHTCKNSDSLVVDNIPFFCESYDQTQMRENALRGRAVAKQISPTDSVIFSLGTLVVNVTGKVNDLAPEAKTCVNKALEQVHETLPLLAGNMYSICKQVDVGPLSDCLQSCIDRGVAPADTDFTVFWKPVCAPYKKPLASSLSGSSTSGNTPPSDSNGNQDASEPSGSDSFDPSDPATFDPSKAIPLDPNQNAASNNPAEASIGPSFTVSSGSVTYGKNRTRSNVESKDIVFEEEKPESLDEGQTNAVEPSIREHPPSLTQTPSADEETFPGTERRPKERKYVVAHS